MDNGLAISVLDLVGMRAGEPAGSAIARSVELAQHVEQLGYKRYWLAEHHSIAGLACAATAVLIGHVAGATKTIRVGSGGVMLPNHAPLVVAEQFGTLEAMYPGRIDLGLGRAPGSDAHTMRALRRDLRQNGDDFPALLEELRTYLGPEKPGQVVKAIPGQGSNVPITLLGSSGFSAQLAGMLGLPFAFAAHFAPEYLYAAAQLYREQFRPSEAIAEAVSDGGGAGDCGGDGCGSPAVVHDTTAALSATDPKPAGGIVASGGFHGAALAGLGAAAVENKLRAAIVGSNATVKAGLEKLVGDTGADEVIVVTDTYEHADRLQSYQRVAGMEKSEKKKKKKKKKGGGAYS